MWPLLFLWNTELFSVFLSTLTAILIFVVTINIIKYMTSDLHIPIRDTSKQHNWRHAKLLSKPCYCSVCEALMVTGEGAYCDCCGVCADRGCIKTADRKIKCKAITSCEKGPARHHWVKANRKSGNNDGAIILSLFRRLLNPAQVVDLAEHPPETALEWCCLLGEVRATVLVAGGDGTIGWVLNAVDKLQLKPSPGVAILPIGTGNDLSRVLGWGKEHHPNFDPGTFLEQVQKARLVELDRWNVQVHPYRHLGIRLPVRNMNMYNYLSVGVDAQVTLDFHRTRESPFYIISSRLINKMLYLTYGTQQVMERGFRDLDQRLEVYLDGVKAELPSIESIVVLNIPSWGAGVHLWNMGADNEDIAPQSYNDNKLEVVALYSSFHIAQLQVGLSQPYRVGQASCVQIKLKALTPVQVDGEPWEQHPAELNITFRNQATVLTCVEVG
ncbi:diacylglycerol kinase epsilon isoform X2 [Periplaneta americana]|uniref:diacylglycerol kinase epsilon isoform X2 n=1 Tax=Periplaneta americana TaxID=6978 RepID=UPI0037E70E1B